MLYFFSTTETKRIKTKRTIASIIHAKSKKVAMAVFKSDIKLNKFDPGV